MDIFEPREMTEALLERKRPKSFLRDTFFSQSENHNTAAVDIHILEGKRRLAPYVAPNAPGVLVQKDGFQQETFIPPLVKPKDVTTAEDVLRSVRPGESVYTDGRGNSAAERAAWILGEDMARLDDSITRREEQQAAEALFTGALVIKGHGEDRTIDFGLNAAQKPVLAGTSKWSDPASNPLADLDKWKREHSQRSGVTATDVVMGADALAAFLDHEKVKTAFDNRQITTGDINFEEVGENVTLVGRIARFGLNLWSYDEWYYDDATSQEKAMVPENKVLITSRRAMFKRHYGVIPENIPVVGERWVKTWEIEDPASRLLMVQSRPLMVPHQKNALVIGTVVD